MTEGEKVTVSGLIGALALFVPAFVFHSAPRFPGSLTGSIFGIAAGLLFVLLLAYTALKRQPWLKVRFVHWFSLGSVLSFHAYAGSVGAILAVIHSGHKFESLLGLMLVISMLIVVFTGFVGRYYLAQVGQEQRQQQLELKLLRDRFDTVVITGAALPLEAATNSPADFAINRLVGAIADLEYAIMARDTIKRTLGRWLAVHIGAAILMYGLLTLHVWSSVYFGLRWLA